MIGVKQGGLSGVYDPSHKGSKSLSDNELQYNPAPDLSTQKNNINPYAISIYRKFGDAATSVVGVKQSQKGLIRF